jgi:maltokinase
VSTVLEVDLAHAYLEPAVLPAPLKALIGPYLARQRWYASSEPPPAVSVVESGLLGVPGARGGPKLLWALASTGEVLYQLVFAQRPDREADARLAGREHARLGSVEGVTHYDATVDNEMALALLEAASGGAQHAKTARPLGAEQSNTSIVYDDEVIFKLFRRLAPGPNRDAEVTTALSQAGFAHVAEPVLRWRNGESDLAFGQRYLAGGTDGWALALTSLRDLFGQDFGQDLNAVAGLGPTSPGLRAEAQAGAQGGDFGGEAGRLGYVTAEMHLALARAFGQQADWSQAWERLLSSLAVGLQGLSGELGTELAGLGADLLGRLGSLAAKGPAIHPHGDYHLAQVMRTDAGWYVLDFEGEPNRPVDERLEATSALKDVAGMLRSFYYAAQFALAQGAPGGTSALEPLASSWEERNRGAFIEGYLSHPGIDALLPASREDRVALCLAFELEKALYELSYERAYRPAWAEIPLKAIRRLLAGPYSATAGRLA